MFIKKTAQLFDRSPAKQLSSREILISRWTLVLLTCLKAVSFEKKPSTKTKLWISKTKPSQRSHEALRVQASSLCKNSNSVISSHISTPRVWRLASCKDEKYDWEVSETPACWTPKKVTHQFMTLKRLWSLHLQLLKSLQSFSGSRGRRNFPFGRILVWFPTKIWNCFSTKNGFLWFCVESKEPPPRKGRQDKSWLGELPIPQCKGSVRYPNFERNTMKQQLFGNYTPIPSICIHN